MAQGDTMQTNMREIIDQPLSYEDTTETLFVATMQTQLAFALDPANDAKERREALSDLQHAYLHRRMLDEASQMTDKQIRHTDKLLREAKRLGGKDGD